MPKGQSLNPHIPVTSNLGEASTTTVLARSFVQQDWIGTMLSMFNMSLYHLFGLNTTRRTWTKLANGELQVAGDQWPVFLYANYMYNPNDPWNGLLHSGLLASVSADFH
jgi:hypothetical protein